MLLKHGRFLRTNQISLLRLIKPFNKSTSCSAVLKKQKSHYEKTKRKDSNVKFNNFFPHHLKVLSLYFIFLTKLFLFLAEANHFTRNRQENRGVQERNPRNVQLGNQGQITERWDLRQEQRPFRLAHSSSYRKEEKRKHL